MAINPKLVSFKRSPAYAHHRAMMNRRDNHIMDALELMRSAVEQSPDNPEYRLDLAQLYCEMGCHEQSARLLLDMLAESGGPAECYYGLALNQLCMNDLAGARESLSVYRRRDPEGAGAREVRRLTDELDFFSGAGRPVSRRLYRAAHIASRACDALRANMADKACRLFERSLEMASEQFEMRSLYALSLFIAGDRANALRQARRAAEGYPPSVRAMCVSAQVYALAGDKAAAEALIDRAIGEKPQGQDLKLMICAMGEMRMDDRVAEYARIALREAPFDRELLHMRAIALKRTGTPDARVARCWARILRIDPEDSIAEFYQKAALKRRLERYELSYDYQVPGEEFARRLKALIDQLSQGYERLEERWREDRGFRQLVRWAAGSEDGRLSRVAMTALTTIEHRESRSLLRSLMFSTSVPGELKMHAALALRLQGAGTEDIMPKSAGLGQALLPDPAVILARLGVGERQLVRYADEVLRREYDISALPQLCLMWCAYRQVRGTAADPLRCVGPAAAALAYNYMLVYGPKPGLGRLSRQFGCDERQLVYYARRIAGCLEHISGQD